MLNFTLLIFKFMLAKFTYKYYARSLFKLSKRSLYYDNVEVERNIDFVFNLGHNNILNQIKPNISFLQLSKFMFKRKLFYLMRHYYKHLLESIEKGEVQILDEILEKNLKYSLYLDLTRFYEQKFTFKLVKKDEPIFIKILNICELQNVNVDRELNGTISEYDLTYSLGGKRISLQKYDAYEELKKEGKNLTQVAKEKEAFEKSEFKEIAYQKLKNEAKANFGIEYIRGKMGKNINEKGAEYITNIIEHLEKKEKNNDPYSVEIRAQFGDYYTLRDSNIEEKIKSTDLFDFFRVTMPSHYNSFLELYESKKGFIQKFVESIRKRLYRKYIFRSKQISKEKTLYVIDVEITSKMRLEILDENNKNVLESVYNYSNRMKRNLGMNFLTNKSDLMEYDTSIYKFSVPDRKWDINNNDYMQSHIVRFEFEKKNKFQNIFKKPYNTMIITDIDISLKGNKHFKFSKDYI